MENMKQKYEEKQSQNQLKDNCSKERRNPGSR